MDLCQDPNGWNNGDVFRQWLDVDLADLLPRGGPGADQRTDRELARVRVETASDLIDLIREWMDVEQP